MFTRLKEWWNSEEANRKIDWRGLLRSSVPTVDTKPPAPSFKIFQGNPRDISQGDKVVFHFKNDPLTYYVGEIHTNRLAPGFIIKTTSRDPMQTRYVALASNEISYRKLTREEYFYYMMSERLPRV